jgi:ketosteroid isomerase-like protein
MATTADVVRAQFEAVNRRDFPAAMDLYADEVELIAPPGDLKSGVFRGRAAVGEWFGDWFRTFSESSFEWLDIVESGDTLALHARFTATGRHSGVELTKDYFYVYEVRHGKVSKVQFCNSFEEALEAAGLAEATSPS